MANLPISEFLRERLAEYDPTFELRKGTGFEQLFFKPLQFIVQPLRDEADDIQTAQSIRRILLTDDPDAFDEDLVDDLISNVFVDRRAGNESSGVAKVFYDFPVAREFAVGSAVFVGNNGLNYTNPTSFAITEAQMSQQIENGSYFFEIPVQSEDAGEDTELEAGGLIQLLNDTEFTSVTNDAPISGGLDRETNTELIERARDSIAVRDLVVGKGFNAILFENFVGSLKELQAIGFGDEEMMRDVLFNTHVGGKVDGYFSAPSILQGEATFTGLLIDTTRQAPATTNKQLNGTIAASIGNPNIDRTNFDPVVEEVKPRSAAIFTSPVDLSSPIDLSANQRIKMTINGVTREFRLAGVNAAETSRNEMIDRINDAFGVNYASLTALSLKVVSNIQGLDSEVIIADPDNLGSGSALVPVFGAGPTYEAYGDGPLVYLEDTHYTVDDVAGTLTRILGSLVVSLNSSGETSTTNVFTDLTGSVFVPVAVNDILTIASGPDAGDYRILAVTDANNLVIDAALTTVATGVQYSIRRTGIKDGEVVFTRYEYNPLSIDVGPLVKLDEDGKTRGIRPGREEQTITDVSFLRIRRIALIDPITLEETGTELDGRGGYGQGGYGQGPYGVGQRADYRLVVNEPHERFSAFEDSYITINQGFQGLSFKVEYDYVPECLSLHNFVRSDNERDLSGDILMKHFLPAYVNGTIEYRVDPANVDVPDNDTLTELVKDFISDIAAGQDLQFSDITQFILKQVDPFFRYGAFIRPFELEARIQNTDGTVTVISSNESLTFPVQDPFPKFTNRVYSPRISHWFGNEITLVRLES